MIIKQNKGQTLFLAAISLIFTVIFIVFAFADLRSMPHEESIFIDNVFLYCIVKLLTFVAVAFLGVSTVYSVKQLFSKEPLVEICDEYFYDNSSAISLGKISWEDMERAYVKSGVLNIDLKNPEAYIAKMNWLQRLFIKGNVKMRYGNVCINTERMKKHKKDFFEEFKKRMPLE